MPRKRDIANLRVTLGEMETELLQVHKSSSLLSIMVGELEMKKAGCDRARTQSQAAEVSERERLGNVQRDMVSLWDLAKEAHRLHALSQAALAPPPLSPGGGGGVKQTFFQLLVLSLGLPLVTELCDQPVCNSSCSPIGLRSQG